MRNKFKLNFDSGYDRLYFNLRRIYRFIKKIFFFSLGFAFKTWVFFEVLSKLTRLVLIFISLLIVYDITLNLPLYIIIFNPSFNTVYFSSGYIALYERILSLTYFTFFFTLSTKYNFYLLFIVLLSFWKFTDCSLRLKYDWLVSNELTTATSFEEFKYIEKIKLNLKSNTFFNHPANFLKKFFLYIKYLFFFKDRTRLLLNYILVHIKKYFIHFLKFYLFNSFNYLYLYLKSILPQLPLLWRPIFKKWSYFGLFRTYRSKWTKHN